MRCVLQAVASKFKLVSRVDVNQKVRSNVWVVANCLMKKIAKYFRLCKGLIIASWSILTSGDDIDREGTAALPDSLARRATLVRHLKISLKWICCRTYAKRSAGSPTPHVATGHYQAVTLR